MTEFSKYTPSIIASVINYLKEDTIPTILNNMSLDTTLKKNYFGYVQVDSPMKEKEAEILSDISKREGGKQTDFIKRNMGSLKRKANSVSISQSENNTRIDSLTQAKPLQMNKIKGIYKNESKRLKKFIVCLKGLLKGNSK